MYWLYGTKKTAAPVIPWYVLGETLELTFILVVESGEALDKTSLCCIQKAHAGWFQAKTSTEDRYLDIGCVLDPSCYLGYLAEGEHEIDFRITIPETADSKLYTIPILVMHDDGAVWPNSTFCGSLDIERIWAEEFEHQPLWQGAFGGCPEFDSGSICIREHVETVTFDDTVQNYMACRAEIADDGSKTFAWTRNGVGIEEIFAVGIARDVDAGELLTQGFITNAEWAWTPGKQLFLHWVTGQMTQTRPSTEDSNAIDILCGVAITATKICFKVQWPSITVTALSFVLEGMAIASDGNGTVYFYGGEYTGGTMADVLYSVSVSELGVIGAEVELTAGGTARRDHNLIYVDGKLYAWGGYDATDTYIDEMWEYDIATDSWTELASGGTPRAICESVEIDGVIYYIGGTNGSGDVTTIDAYDIAADSWSEPDTLPQDLIDIIENPDGSIVGTQYLGASGTITLPNMAYEPGFYNESLISGGLYDNKLYYIINGEPDTIAGEGEEEEEVHTTFVYYDLLTSTWAKVDTTGGPGACKWGAIAGNYFYGYASVRYSWGTVEETQGASLWRFNLLTGVWAQLANDDEAANRESSDLIFFSDGTNLYVWGGWTLDGTDPLSVYDPLTGNWSQLDTGVHSARDKFAWTVKNGYLYVFGGDDVGEGTPSSEAYSRTINLSTGAIGTFGPGTGLSGSNYSPRGLMSWYEDRYYRFDWVNYEYPHNQVFVWLENGQVVYTPLSYPDYATNSPIKFGYKCYIPTVSVDGDDFTFTAWAWDMRTTTGYYLVTSVVNGELVYTTTYGDVTQAQVLSYSWDPTAGWTAGTGVRIGTKYNKVIVRGGTYGSIYVQGGVSNTSASVVIASRSFG